MQVCSSVKRMEKQKQIRADLGTIQAEKILSVSARPLIVSRALSTNKIDTQGSIYYDILFLNLDGATESANCKTDFSEQLDFNGIENDTAVIMSVCMIDNQLKTNGDGTISVNTTINLQATALLKKDIEIADVAELELCTQKTTSKITQIQNVGEKNFEVGNRVELGKNFAGLLNASAVLASAEYYAQENTLVACGQIATNIYYKTTDENYPIMTKSTLYDYKFEFPIDDANEKMGVLGETILKVDKITAEVDEESGDIILAYPMTCHYILLNQIEVDSITDCYSLENETTLENTNQQVISLPLSNKFNEQIHTNLDLDADYQSIEKVVGYSGDSVLITKAIAENGAINFEGLAYANILYIAYDQNSENKMQSSVIAEMPFSFRLNFDGVEENDEVILHACLSDFDARAKRAQELDIFAQMSITATVFKTQNVNLTLDIKMGKEKQKSDAGLSIYFVSSGASAWDIAKNLSITQEQLFEQNPNLTFPLNDNQKIICYRNRKAEA